MNYPNIDSVAFRIFSLPIHWYGIMYLLGLLIAFYLLHLRAKADSHNNWSQEQIVDLLFYGALGVIVGGRLGHILFYRFDAVLSDWTYIFKIWNGGMSFHGGLIGVGLAIWFFCWKQKKSFAVVADFAVPVTPLGLGAGRIGNFINGELWGKPTDLPWGFTLDCAKLSGGNAHLSRFCEPGSLFTKPLHPSQLYEFLFEGLVLFAIIWIFARKSRPVMSITGLFLICYGVIRFLVELIRLPDEGKYAAWGWLSTGQILSIPMIAIGAVMFWLAYHRHTVSFKDNERAS